MAGFFVPALFAVTVSAPASSSIVVDLQTHFDPASCPAAGDPANRAAIELPALRSRVEDTEQPSPELLDELAAAYELVEDFAAAQKALERALAQREATAAPVQLLETLARIGLMQRARGEAAQAELTLQRCLALAESHAIQETRAAIYCHNLLGVAYRDLGRYAEAENQLQTGLAKGLRLPSPEHAQVGYSHNLLGTLYMLLGDYRRAEEHYLRSLNARALAFGRCSAITATALHFLADAYDATRRHDLALRVRTLSLALRERVLPPQDHAIGHGLMGLGETFLALDMPDEAERALRRSLEIHLKVFGPRHQRSLRSRWWLAKTTRQSSEAEALQAAGLRDANSRDTPEFLWRFQHGYSELLRARGDLSAAVYFGKQAVDTIQGIRARVTGLDRELQTGFLQDKSVVYRSLADLLIDQGRLAEAQQVLAMLKEEEFFDFIRRDGAEDLRGTRPAFTAVEQPWVKRYAQISGELASLGARRDELERRRKAGLSEPEQAQLRQIDADAEVARKGFVVFLDELVRETTRLDAQRRTELAKRDVEGLENYQDDLKQLGPGVVMVHYVVLPDKLRIVLTSSDVQIGRTAPVDERTLNRRVQAFREALRNPRSDPRQPAKALHEALIAPIAADLRQAGAQTLMVSLDGVLRYVPFAALHDGERYLVQDYRITVLTEAAKSRLTVQDGGIRRFAGLGLTRKLPGFDALPAVKEELEGILTGGSLVGEMHLDEAFTAERMRQALSQRVSLLHIASHFVFNPGTETDSFLLLGDGSRLSLRDLREAGYSFRGVDLLTLSACDTAMGGGADANGREVEGLGALAQSRGARAVMATLWPVADASTGLLMQQFYRLRMGEGGVTKAEALRQAQLLLLDGRHRADGAKAGERGVASLRPRRPVHGDVALPYTHPYFWAPFILMGNWL